MMMMKEVVCILEVNRFLKRMKEDEEDGQTEDEEEEDGGM